MKSPRYLHCIYADDVRQEINNKLIIVGMYQGGMQVSAIPTQLPNLYIVAMLHLPADDTVESLSLDVSWDGREVMTTVPPASLFHQVLSQNVKESTGVILQMVINLTPFTIDKEERLQVTVTVNGTEAVRGNALRITQTKKAAEA